MGGGKIKIRIISVLTLLIILSNISMVINVNACKNMIACGDATDGDYNLLLKIRDPSRPDYQVLTMIPEGFEYTYHRPWLGFPMKFITKNKFIGVTSLNDTASDIVKAGMVFTDSGIAFGDADTDSRWINPSKYAWDDFDWMRYSYQKAQNECEAVNLLTKDAVSKLHATGVSENLFVVGPNKAYVIEADAFHYNVSEVKDILVMTNYPKNLWKTHLLNKLPIAPSFDTIKEQYLSKGEVLRLDSLYGVKIFEVGSDYIIVRESPYFKIFGGTVKIELGEIKKIGQFSVELKDIDGNKAKISLCYYYKAWEDKMIGFMEEKNGNITVKDMINWSRIHEDDIDGLRPMCQDSNIYEAAMIYKIRKENYEILSSGWFAANHPCSSIYVPVHICVNDIFEPYENGNAAKISLELLESFGHDNLTDYFCKVEDVLLYENEKREEYAKKFIENTTEVTEFLTDVDYEMQNQGYLTEEIWMDASNISDIIIKEQVIEIIGDMWFFNYSISLENMDNAISELDIISENDPIIDLIICKIQTIIQSINLLRRFE